MALQDRFDNLDNKQMNNTLPLSHYDIKDMKCIVDNIESVMFEKLEKSIISKIESTPDWFSMTVEEQKKVLFDFASLKIAEADLLFLDQDFHLSRVIDKIIVLESEFLDLDVYLHGDNSNNIVYVTSSGSIYVESNGIRSKSGRVLDEKQLLKLKRNILRMRGLDENSSVISLNFRYNNFIISAVFAGGISIALKKASCCISDNPMFKALAQLNLNILVIGDYLSGKSLFMEKLLNTAVESLDNSFYPILLQYSPLINSTSYVGSSFETEFIQDANSFERVYDNILRLNASLYVDGIQNNFIPVVLNNMNRHTVISFRAKSIGNCIEHLTCLYTQLYGGSCENILDKLFSDIDLVIELDNVSADDVKFKQFYLVNKENKIELEPLNVSADSFSAIIQRLFAVKK